LDACEIIEAWVSRQSAPCASGSALDCHTLSRRR
jgi:hypothetical protein